MADTTDTANRTLKDELDSANATTMPAALAKVKVGTHLTLIKETITLAAVAASVNLATLSVAKRPAWIIKSLRVSDVTGGASARVGTYVITDAAGTALDPQADSPGVAKLSDDGVTLTFAATIKAIVIAYYPMPDTDLTSKFAPNTL